MRVARSSGQHRLSAHTMLFFILLAQTTTLPPPPPPPEICSRTYLKHAGGPVDESYTVIGKAPKSGKLYSGTLSVRFSQGRYVLTRKTPGSTVRGEAWDVRCGPDKVSLLQVRYKTKPFATSFLCTITVNYDNYSLASCESALNAGQTVTGLEAWFPALSDQR